MSTDFFGGNWPKFDAAAGLLFTSWAMHYFPFNLFGRQLFLHHYMPSLYMATLIIGVFFEILTRKVSFKIRWALVAIITVALIYVYQIFLPITYGEPWSTKKCLEATWRPNWDMSCQWYDLKPKKTATSKATEIKPMETLSFEQRDMAVEIPNIVNIIENQDQVNSPADINKKASVAKNEISYETIETKRSFESPKSLIESHSMETANFLPQKMETS